MMQQTRRLVLILGILLFVGLLGLAGRVSWISLTTHEEAAARMDRQSLRVETLEARRGSLLDRHGRILASSTETLRVEVLPRNVHQRTEDELGRKQLVGAIAGFLAPIVRAPASELVRRLDGERWTVLGEPVSDPALLEDLEAERRRLLYGVDLRSGWDRRYPWGATAGNLIGYVNHENHGVAGLEAGLEQKLAGHDGARRFRVDHLGREVVEAGHDWLAPVDGLDVLVTVDARLQQIVEEEALSSLAALDASRVTVVALQPSTGDVLAMCSVPGIDLADGADRGEHGSVCAAVQEIYAPGSTFKPLMLAAAIELGLADPDGPPVDCRRFDGRPIRDTHPKEEPLTLEEIIVHSSNIGMATLLTRLVPPDRARESELMRPVHELLGKLGFGQPTGIPVPAEAPGKVTPLRKWTRNYTLASVAFGQELGVSALQMAAAASALVDGSYRRPRLVFACTSADGERADLPGSEPVRVFAAETARLVRGYMQRAAEESDCQEIKLPGVALAGKTGTAEDETELGKEIHSYVALVPAEDPYLTLVVVVRHPQGVRYASQSAAPAAGRILRRVLPYLGQPLGE